MVLLNCKEVDKDIWTGRVDSESNFDAFRWHQWIEQIDLDKEDLKPFEGELGFVFIGFCSDEGVRRNKGRQGAANGPRSIRKELSNTPCRFTKELRLFDAGDVVCENEDLEQAQNRLKNVVARALDLNLFPIVLGGGHEVAFGHYCGILNYKKKESKEPKIGIINFDAHFDIRPYENGGTSGTMFRQIADICEAEKIKYSYMCIGVQKYSNTVDLFKTADSLGAEYILAKDIQENDDWRMFEKIDKYIRKNEEIYITICADVFSSAFAPGVSATQPLGLNPEKVLKIIKYILKSDKVVSFDIAEVSPRFDQDNTTSNLAKVIIFSLVNTLAELKGIDV